MKYTLHVTSVADLELHEAALWWAEHRDVDQAITWIEGFQAELSRLVDNPEQHAVAHEDEAFPYALRQVLYGLGNKPTHRALYRIRGEQVIAMGIRHLHQRDVTPKDFQSP